MDIIVDLDKGLTTLSCRKNRFPSWMICFITGQLFSDGKSNKFLVVQSIENFLNLVIFIISYCHPQKNAQFITFWNTFSNLKKKKNRQNALVNLNSAKNAHFMLWPKQFKKKHQIKAWCYRIDLKNSQRSCDAHC